MKKWYSYKFQSGPRTGAEFKQFARDLRKELNKQLKSLGIKIAKYRVNHFYVSGFVEKTVSMRTLILVMSGIIQIGTQMF